MIHSQKKKRLLWLSITLLISISSCKNDIEKFYSESKEVGAIVIPVIYPCYLVSHEGRNGEWHVCDADATDRGGTDLGQLQEMDIVDSIFVAIYFNKYLNPEIKKDTTWLICIPTIDLSRFIDTREDFEETLKRLSSKKPRFRPIASVWLDFNENGYLKCFPQSTSYLREPYIIRESVSEHRYW